MSNSILEKIPIKGKISTKQSMLSTK